MTQPAYNIKIGKVEASLWPNNYVMPDGKEITSYKMRVVEKYYDKKEEKLKNTDYISERQFGNMVKCVGKAWDWIIFHDVVEERK